MINIKKDLSIIIVTYNSKNVIKTCIESIKNFGCRVLLIDNNSSDETVKIAKKILPSIEIFQQKKNLGYGRGNNIGLKQTKTKYAIIMNPDAALTLKGTENMIKALEENSDICLAAPSLCETTEKWKVDSKKVTVKNLAKHVVEIGGAVMIANMKNLKQIGFFDEKIFLYGEELDLCRRSVKAGFKNACLEGLYALHLHETSGPQTLEHLFRKGWHYGWSNVYFRTKYKGKRNAYSSAFRFGLRDLFSSICYLIAFKIKKAFQTFGRSLGRFGYLFGMNAFDKKGNPRGNLLTWTVKYK